MPIIEQLPGNGSYASRITLFAPQANLGPNLINFLVFFNQVFGFFVEEVALSGLLAGLGNWDEIIADAPAFKNYPGRIALRIKFVMPLGFFERRIDDRVIDGDPFHWGLTW